MRKPSRSLLETCRSTERASQKISNQLCDLVRLLVERKVPAIENVGLRPRHIALISGRLGNQERGVVPAPNNQRGRLIQPQPGAPRGIAGDVGAVIVEQIGLDVGFARPAQKRKLVRPSIGIECLGIWIRADMTLPGGSEGEEIRA